LVHNDQCREAFNQFIKLKKDSLNKSSAFDSIRVSENIYNMDISISSYSSYTNNLESLFDGLLSDMITLRNSKSVEYFFFQRKNEIYKICFKRK
jgi:hypothetical protein